MNKDTLEHEMLNVINAVITMRKALEEMFPVNSEVCVKLNCKQEFPTSMKVVGHDGRNGTVRCSMPSKRRSGFFVRDISFRNIVAWEQKKGGSR